MAKKDDKLHAEGLKLYDIAVERDAHNREAYEDDIKFARLGDQWPEQIRAQREKDGRPCLTINRMTSFIRQVTNDARQNKPQIKFHPVGDGADQETAKVLDGLARQIQVSSNADVAYDTAIENAVSGNVGYFRMVTDYAAEDVFDQDIKIERIPNSLSVVPDPYDLGADSSEWNDCWVIETYSLDAFKEKWPKASTDSFEGDRRDVASGWLDGDEVQVAEWWRRRPEPATLVQLSNGMVMLEDDYLKHAEIFDVAGVSIQAERQIMTPKVTQHIMNGCEIIESNAWAGKYIPIIPVYGDEVIIEGKRYLKSLIRDAKDAQRMFNYWRTTSTELVALAPKAPWVGPVGSFATDPKWATANTQNHQHLEYDPVPEAGNVPPQRQGFTGPPAGALQEAMNASDDMKSIMGLYDASLGAQSNETSGRAILARQREGDTSTFNFTDNLSRAIRHAGRILTDLIPKVYTTPRMLRVLEEDGTNRNVPINGQPPPQPTPQELAEQQEKAEGMMRVYDLATGKYDVTCESGPSYNTKREEAAVQMTEFMRAVPGAGQVMGDLVAKSLDWPGADELAERLKLMLPPQAQGQNPQLMQMQQQMQQMQAALGEAQQKLQATEQDKSIDARKMEIDAYNAETNRLKVVGAGMGPEQVQALVMQTLQQVLSSQDVAPAAAPPQQQMAPPPPPDQQMQEQQQPPEGVFFSPEQPPEGFQQ